MFKAVGCASQCVEGFPCALVTGVLVLSNRRDEQSSKCASSRVNAPMRVALRFAAIGCFVAARAQLRRAGAAAWPHPALPTSLTSPRRRATNNESRACGARAFINSYKRSARRRDRRCVCSMALGCTSRHAIQRSPQKYCSRSAESLM